MPIGLSPNAAHPIKPQSVAISASYSLLSTFRWATNAARAGGLSPYQSAACLGQRSRSSTASHRNRSPGTLSRRRPRFSRCVQINGTKISRWRTARFRHGPPLDSHLQDVKQNDCKKISPAKTSRRKVTLGVISTEGRNLS